MEAFRSSKGNYFPEESAKAPEVIPLLTYIKQQIADCFAGLRLPQILKATAMEIAAGFVKALNDAEKPQRFF